MPILYTIDRARCQLRTRIEGLVTVDDILAHLEAVRREQALPFAELIDVNGAQRPFLSPAEIWRTASALEAQQLPRPVGPRAIVAQDDLVYGLTRIFTNLLSGQIPIRVFRSLETAEEWIANRVGPLGLG